MTEFTFHPQMKDNWLTPLSILKNFALTVNACVHHCMLMALFSLYRVKLSSHTIYAGINLTGYHPPPPRAPRGFYTEMCAQLQGFCTTENAWGPGQYIYDVPGAGHLHQHEDC